MNTNCARSLHAEETEHRKWRLLLLWSADKELGKREIKHRLFLQLTICVQLTAQNLTKALFVLKKIPQINSL